MKRGRPLSVLLTVVALSLPVAARAQGTPAWFVSAGVSAVFSQESGSRIVGPPDGRGTVIDRGGTTTSGIFGVGASLSPKWNLRFEFGLMGSVDFTSTTSTDLIVQTSRGESTRKVGSVLVGYLSPARGRVSVGFVGGVAFIHERQHVTVETEITTPVPVPPTFFDQAETEAWTYRQAPQVGIEAVVSATPRVAIVPAFNLIAYSGTWLLQPGVSLRLRF